MERTASAVGSYALLHRIAGGARADVYLARGADRSGQEQLVCVRRLQQAFVGDAASAGRFLGEAQQAALFRHPNIARVVEIGGDYCAIEYVHGCDLARVVATAADGGVPISLDAAIAIGLAICAALHHAHELVGPDGARLGVLHRGLAPRAVLVGYDGTVKLVGFALPQPRLGSAKLAYASPEAAAGQPIDRRGDIWSLGAILYELTTGARPFRGGEVPGPLAAIVKRALARDPAHRYQTVEQLAGDLDAVARAASLPTTQASIARVMSSLFPGRLEDWQKARAQGQFFVEQHVLAALTAEGTGSHLALAALSEDDAPTSITPLNIRKPSPPFVAVGSAPGVAQTPLAPVIPAGAEALGRNPDPELGERTELVRTKAPATSKNPRELRGETMLVHSRAPRRTPLLGLVLGGIGVAGLGVLLALHFSGGSPSSGSRAQAAPHAGPATVAPHAGAAVVAPGKTGASGVAAPAPADNAAPGNTGAPVVAAPASADNAAPASADPAPGAPVVAPAVTESSAAPPPPVIAPTSTVAPTKIAPPTTTGSTTAVARAAPTIAAPRTSASPTSGPAPSGATSAAASTTGAKKVVPAWRRVRPEPPPPAPRPAVKATPAPKPHKGAPAASGQPYDDDSPFMPVRPPS
ncbi:MAG TPA: protein kinase [Kofleriaceae bacterium]